MFTSAEELTGRNLGTDAANGWRIEKFIAVYDTDQEGRSVASIPKGLYKDPVVAQAIEKQETFVVLREIFTLTNGDQAFILDSTPVNVSNDEEAKVHLRDKALAKLSPEERAILGFSPS